MAADRDCNDNGVEENAIRKSCTTMDAMQLFTLQFEKK